MRTTLEIDDTVLAAARAKAMVDGISIGAALSQLALQGIRRSDAPSREHTSSFPVITGAPGHVITDALVAHYRDDTSSDDDAA